MQYVALEGAFEAVGAPRGVERTDAVLRSLVGAPIKDCHRAHIATLADTEAT